MGELSNLRIISLRSSGTRGFSIFLFMRGGWDSLSNVGAPSHKNNIGISATIFPLCSSKYWVFAVSSPISLAFKSYLSATANTLSTSSGLTSSTMRSCDSAIMISKGVKVSSLK